MATPETIAEQFSEFGLEPSSDIVGKCVDICHAYDLAADKFVEQWMAFSMTNLNGAEPSCNYLDDLERKELASLNRKAQPPPQTPTTSRTSGQTAAHRDLGDADDVMEAYVCTTPKSVAKVQSRVQITNESAQCPQQTISSPFSDVTKLPSATSGSVVYTFGSSTLEKITNWSCEKRQIEIKQISQSVNKRDLLNVDEKFMLNKLIGNSLYSADRLYTFGRDIYTHHFKKKFDDKMVMFSDLGNVNEKSLHAMKTIGRVVGDGTVTTKLTKNSVHLIDGDDATVRMVELDLSQMHSFAVFPGQTIMVQGTNPSGKLFHVQQVITDRLLERNESSLSEPVNMVIVSGPYTNENDLAYEPLHDVINYCKKHKPNILIMIGPFLHERHTSIQNGTLRESFEVYFEKIIAGIMDAVGKDTKVLVVSSAQDAHSTSVYPTHPYRLSREYSNLTLLPDPCTVDIGGFLIGITSTDIVKHLSDTEVTSNAGEKLKRIVNYLLYQGAFYPLDPPDVNVYLDIELADKYGQMRIIPNMLILPSDLRYFIRDINNCLVVNPGHVADVNGGTMNRIVVFPKKDETSLQNHVFSQIIKI